MDKQMQHDHMHMQDRVHNMPHQHSLTLVGYKTIFCVHMTQYHHEEHKYQLVLSFELPAQALAAYREQREAFPGDYFTLCNDPGDLLTIPDIASGRRPTFKANIFQGLPPFTEEDKGAALLSWALSRVKPIAGGFEARVARPVLYRVFAHHYGAGVRHLSPVRRGRGSAHEHSRPRTSRPARSRRRRSVPTTTT